MCNIDCQVRKRVQVLGLRSLNPKRRLCPRTPMDSQTLLPSHHHQQLSVSATGMKFYDFFVFKNNAVYIQLRQSRIVCVFFFARLQYLTKELCCAVVVRTYQLAMRGLATISEPSRLLTADDDNNAGERRRTASATECSVPVGVASYLRLPAAARPTGNCRLL